MELILELHNNGINYIIYRRRHPSVSGDDGVAPSSVCTILSGCGGRFLNGSPCRIWSTRSWLTGVAARCAAFTSHAS